MKISLNFLTICPKKAIDTEKIDINTPISIDIYTPSIIIIVPVGSVWDCSIY